MSFGCRPGRARPERQLHGDPCRQLRELRGTDVGPERRALLALQSQGLLEPAVQVPVGARPTAALAAGRRCSHRALPPSVAAACDRIVQRDRDRLANALFPGWFPAMSPVHRAHALLAD